MSEESKGRDIPILPSGVPYELTAEEKAEAVRGGCPRCREKLRHDAILKAESVGRMVTVFCRCLTCRHRWTVQFPIAAARAAEAAESRIANQKAVAEQTERNARALQEDADRHAETEAWQRRPGAMSTILCILLFLAGTSFLVATFSGEFPSTLAFALAWLGSWWAAAVLYAVAGIYWAIRANGVAAEHRERGKRP